MGIRWNRAVLLVVLALGARTRAQTTAPSITLRSVRHLENATIDQHGKQFETGGLSGVAYLGGDEYVAVEDNSDKLVRLRITLKSDGAIDTVTATSGITVSESKDFEGIVFTGRERATVLLSEEGADTIREYRLSDGERVGVIEPPIIFRPPNLRSNFGFESLTARGNDELWTANEEALSSDGDRSDATYGTAVRLLRFARGGDGNFAPAQQYVYITEPIHKAYSDVNRAMSRSGVSDLLALPNGRLLVLERSFSLMGPKNVFSDFENRIFEVRVEGATDVSAAAFAEGLRGKEFVPVRKRLLWKHRGNDIANLEGLALGPQLGPDRWVLIGVVDNNREPLFANRVVSFELDLGNDRADRAEK
jgi:hypothetical protein